MRIQVNHNNNLESFQTMKISTTPRRSKTPEKEESPLVGSGTLPEVEESWNSSISRNDELEESNESKITVNVNVKTDFKDGEVSRLCRSKRISCQDTIPESDEDNRDNELTMERVGRSVASAKIWK